jgi:hypothetical protein
MAKGWLDNFGKDDNYNDYQTHAPEGFQGDGYSNVGRNSSPAWGGQFQTGGKLKFLQPTSDKLPKEYRIPYSDPSSERAMSIGGEDGEPSYLIPSFKYGKPLNDPMGEFRKTGEHLGGPFKTWQEADKWENETRHPAVEKGENIMFPQKEFQMGGVMPGAVGHMYARHGSPSKGPRRNQTDVTDASAQNGKEMQYYQQGLDWKPKTISQDGSKTSKFDFKKFTKDQKANTPLQQSINKEAQSEDSRRWFDTKEYKDQVKANQLAKDKAIVQDRKDRLNKSAASQKKSFTKDNWRQQLADETQATGDKFRMFPDEPNNFVDEWLNPGVMIGNMASDLGSAPLRAQQEDSYMPYVTSIGVPLLTGGIEGIGAKSNTQFINNLINPLNIIPGYHSAEKYIGNKLGDISERIAPKLEQPILSNASSIGRKTKQFLKNNIFTDKTFNRLEAVDNSIQKLPKIINPLHHIEAQKSLDKANQWMDNWYNHPITKEKITEASSRYGPKSYNEEQLLKNIENKNYRSEFESNLNKLDNFVDGNPRVHQGNYGVSGWYLDPYKNLSKRQNLVDKYINPDMITSTAIHEGNHGLTNGNSFITGYEDVLQSPFNLKDFKPRLDSGSYEKTSDYLLDPTEINARLSEIRYEHGLKPGENLTPERADEIIDKGISGKSKVDPEFFNLINDRNKFRYMMNYVPAVTGAVGTIGAASQINNNESPQLKQGGVIKDDRGQWDHPGEITEIGSNDITMQGVPYDVLGISDTGDTKLMKPGKNYKFKGKKVTEFPMAKNGLRQEQKGLQNLDNLTNFTNYNTKQPGGWLDNL